MPVLLKSVDGESPFGMIDTLFKSLRKFAANGLFEQFYIIAPPQDISAIEAHVSQYDFISITVINELELLPDLNQYAEYRLGWRVQQLLKLAIAERVNTPFYLTFDQDIFCTHPLSEDNLLPGGRALLQREKKTVHKKWWQSSAYHLKMKTDLSGYGMKVTPAILATEPTRALLKELSIGENWVDRLMKPHIPKSLHQYHPRFKNRHRWTEYSLYYLYLEKYKLVDTYHVPAGGHRKASHTLLSENAVWKKEGLAEWNPDLCFSEQDKSLFSLVQSTTGVAPNYIYDRIKHHFD